MSSQFNQRRKKGNISEKEKHGAEGMKERRGEAREGGGWEGDTSKAFEDHTFRSTDILGIGRGQLFKCVLHLFII
jgi:hypothetical protein